MHGRGGKDTFPISPLNDGIKLVNLTYAGKQDVPEAGHDAAPRQDCGGGRGRGLQGARDGAQEHLEGHGRNGIVGLKGDGEAHQPRDTVSHNDSTYVMSIILHLLPNLLDIYKSL